jgi:transcriptional regulator with XRE-family HTH domain
MGQARTFGLLLRQWRNQTGLSLQELGLADGMSKDHLSRIERGHVPPPRVDPLDKLAAVLGLPNEVLYEAARRPSAGADQESAAAAFG